MNRKIFSIAPSFNCKLSCEGCYLTTDVTKDMRDATKEEAYYLRAIEVAAASGYTDFAITWNPFPGAYEMTKKYVLYAKKHGMSTSVTTVLTTILEAEDDFFMNLDVLTISVDDMRFRSISAFDTAKTGNFNFLASWMWEDRVSAGTAEEGSQKAPGFSDYFPHIVINYNLLWTPAVFEWLYSDTTNFRRALDNISYPDTVQHLIYKPLSIYESEAWFWTNYQKVFAEYPWVNIAGDGNKFIGDIALNNLLGINNCPGQDFQMVDVDPMGYVRRCPENPISYDGRNIQALRQYLQQGTGCQNEKCNCITS